MKIISNNDSYADALSTASIATIPFMAYGLIRDSVVLWITAVVSILLFIGFLVRLYRSLLNPSIIRTAVWLDNIMSWMQIPYVTSLLGLVFLASGWESVPFFWIAIVCAVVGIIGTFIFKDDE